MYHGEKMEEEYPFDLFLTHFNAMKYVLKYETIHIKNDGMDYSIDVSDDHSIGFIRLMST